MSKAKSKSTNIRSRDTNSAAKSTWINNNSETRNSR